MKITASTAQVLAATSLVTGLVTGLVSGSAWAANPITVWVRTPGSYDQSGTAPPKTNPQTLDLDKLPQQQGQRPDAQYGSSGFYRGVALRDVIKAYAPPSGVDLALLHFRNGMIVPVPFRDNRIMTRLDLLIATGRGTSAQGPFVSDFPPISKQVEGFADIRQVTFTGNKVVAADRYHPDVGEPSKESFSPWATTDSLTGIEFVDNSAYYRQFVPDAAVRPGFDVFRGSCQFCHGIRKVGASYGWDYAQPLELHTYRSSPQSLYMHIRYRVEYKATWQQMPALKHITEEDAGHMWRWMRATSAVPIGRYTPMK